MSGIRGANTQPERHVRSALHRAGLRFRINSRKLPGRPDIVLPKYRAVVFVHGCFWHRHNGCRYATSPSTNRDFWAKKFDGNVKRDSRNSRALRRLGWRVYTVWECDIRRGSMLSSLIRRITAD